MYAYNNSWIETIDYLLCCNHGHVMMYTYTQGGGIVNDNVLTRCFAMFLSRFFLNCCSVKHHKSWTIVHGKEEDWVCLVLLDIFSLVCDDGADCQDGEDEVICLLKLLHIPHFGNQPHRHKPICKCHCMHFCYQQWWIQEFLQGGHQGFFAQCVTALVKPYPLGLEVIYQ